MRFLRTNTAVRVTVGPFFSPTDGVTPKTALTVTSCKLTLMVDVANVPTLVLDTNPTASGGTNDMVHVTGDDSGFYDLELAAADVNYLGRAMLALTDAANHCPVFHEFMILPADRYDALVLGTDRWDANVTHVADTAQTPGDIIGALTIIATNLLTVAGYVDTEVAAIKLVTDRLNTALELSGSNYRFTFAALGNVGAQVSAESAVTPFPAKVEMINETSIIGAGTILDPFRAA